MSWWYNIELKITGKKSVFELKYIWTRKRNACIRRNFKFQIKILEEKETSHTK